MTVKEKEVKPDPSHHQSLDMEKDWAHVATYSLAALAELNKAVLQENGIEAIILNAQDSSYLFGSIDLYVHRDDVLKAKRILEEQAGDE